MNRSTDVPYITRRDILGFIFFGLLGVALVMWLLNN